MKITSQIAVAALFFGLMSCSDSAKTENTTATSPAATAPATTPNQAATPATTVGLNPPHGEPNHRCDIEVGAPLDSPPKPNLSAPSSVPAFTPSTSSQSVAPGMNPPHGQPGHDCGIPVGAPLTQK
jgi:hypothetical protein